jgi:hypothetical protein
MARSTITGHALAVACENRRSGDASQAWLFSLFRRSLILSATWRSTWPGKSQRIHGFASPSYDGFAFVEDGYLTPARLPACFPSLKGV